MTLQLIIEHLYVFKCGIFHLENFQLIFKRCVEGHKWRKDIRIEPHILFCFPMRVVNMDACIFFKVSNLFTCDEIDEINSDFVGFCK